MIAALFVEATGVYSGCDDVDAYDVTRDARTYAGPHPLIAHPPCERFGRYWSGGPSVRVRRVMGDDGGCFIAALQAVRTWGGVLEHPEASHAWRIYGLARPPRSGGWVVADDVGGWTCCVEQGHYGHAARKATWLYAVRCELPSLRWGRSSGRRLEDGYHSTYERRVAREMGIAPVKRLSARERIGTPPAFANALLAMARSVRSPAQVAA